ncbi:hypothetical protein HYDPIDRAFT_115957 [Hydnomerulius pinastri MD-312]|uniref:Unplaced genomic scaffold scaffold_28, whole genome shotgun sequence n=1 Tax=Hydnomerulius pinastri MD-312 TaxID=994086 RepID=A0A0C9WBT2_9AGAM|nr:hypothetical protein HYDPIDRAFT_115957 [Hydnomerulius pinastri MD-312]
MTGEEQQAVLSVFVGFFGDDEIEEPEYESAFSANQSSVEEEESVVDEPQHRGLPSFPSSSFAAPKQPSPPTPINGNFQFVNPSSFFVDNITTPPNPTKNLPALSMDHLATLAPSNPGRSADPASASVGGVFGFQNWASEAGIASQQPQPQPAKPTPASTSASQTLGARARATDNISRQASAASTSASSPPLFANKSSPQYSPPVPAAKVSPPVTTENLALGKRYIGPVIVEEEPEPVDEDLLRSKMAAEYQEYKVSLRLQMIYQFHAEAAEIEIRLVQTLLEDEGTKESRARVVQDHETSMMLLREQKEEERKRLCAEERDRRREEIKMHLAQARSAQNREIDPRVAMKANLSKQRAGQTANHQKENVPLTHPVASSSKLELPGILKKSNSALSQDDASSNEAMFAKAMEVMAQGKLSSAGMSASQASSNEALFAHAAAKLSAQGKLGTNGLNVPQRPSIMKQTSSARSQEQEIPQINVSLAEPSAPTPTPAPAPPATAKTKKGKKGQQVTQQPVMPVSIAEEPDIDAEPPPPPSLWSAAAATAKSAWGAATAPSAPTPALKHKRSAFITEEPDVGATPTTSSWGSISGKNTVPAGKKGKAVTITEEPDVDADPIASLASASFGSKSTKGGWGSVNGKSRMAATVAEEESEPEPAPAPPVTSASAWGKKNAKAPTKTTVKQQPKTAFVSEELESEPEPVPVPSRGNKGTAKTAWGASVATPANGTGKQTGKKATQQQQGRGSETSASKSVRVESVPDPEDDWAQITTGGGNMPGALNFAGPEDAEEDEDGGPSSWFDQDNADYWANFMAGQAESQMQPAVESTAKGGKHVRWTPAIDEDSEEEEDEDESGALGEDLESDVWLQYAISGGEVPSLGAAAAEPQVTPSDNARGTSIWEQGKGKKKANQTSGDRAQQASGFDRAAFPGGQWQKMEGWVPSAPRVGQSSGSARFF